MTELTARLDEVRGAAPACRHNARTIAALTTNPGCSRRALMDAAAVDKTVVARELGYPARFGQSQFAITRGNSFEAYVKANGCAQLLALLRERFGLTLPEVSYDDLNTVGDNAGNAVRHRRTRQLLGEVVRTGAGTLFDHPMLALDIAGVTAYLEPDVIAVQIDGYFHVVEIKSIAVIDGQAAPEQVAAAARQSAVYVLALRQLLAEVGGRPEQVSHEVILVCPRDFSNQPTAAKVDIRKQLAVITRQLSRLTRIQELVEVFPPELSFASGDQLLAAVSAVDGRYAPECMSSCELAFFCRAEARAQGSVDVLGRSICDEVGGIDSIALALALADGAVTPAPEQADIAAQLRFAQVLRQEAFA
ncbi:hypothetical protein ACWIGI_04960 [Nocardia sp. NPDC055321]